MKLYTRLTQGGLILKDTLFLLFLLYFGLPDKIPIKYVKMNVKKSAMDTFARHCMMFVIQTEIKTRGMGPLHN